MQKILKITIVSNYCQGRVAWWLGTYAQKPKVPGSSRAASYAQR